MIQNTANDKINHHYTTIFTDLTNLLAHGQKPATVYMTSKTCFKILIREVQVIPAAPGQQRDSLSHDLIRSCLIGPIIGSLKKQLLYLEHTPRTLRQGHTPSLPPG